MYNESFNAKTVTSPLLSIRNDLLEIIVHSVSIRNMWMIKILVIGQANVMEKCNR